MYFTDANHLESHLNEDWTVLLRNIKSREDTHFQLLQYNKRLIAKQRLEQDLFVNDQILQHHQQICKVTQMNSDLDREEKPIIDKYQGNSVSNEGISKLMGRVGARILQIFQSSMDNCKSLNGQLVQQHSKMKTNLIKLINQKECINLEEITILVIEYSRSKLLSELQRLKKIVSVLQNGQFSKLQQIYECKPKKPARLSISIQKKINVSKDKAKVSSVGKQERSPIHEEIKRQQKIKKQKQKLAVKLVNGIYSTMQLSKQQLIEDFSCRQKQSDRLYTEIFIRNRLNYEQIKQFQAKRDQFNEKVRLFKQMMERDSQKIACRLQGKAKNTPKTTNNTKVIDKQQRKEIKKEQQEPLLIEQISTQQQNPQKKAKSNRYRIQSPKAKKQWKQIIGNTSFYESRNDQFNHFKFDTKNQSIYPRTNRNKLPLISTQNSQTMNRTSSVDQHLELNKTKIFRNHRAEIKEEMDGQQLGWREKEEKYIAHKAAIRIMDVGHNNKLVGREAKQIEPSPMEYTFYVRKSHKKLNQVKLNALL